jgi:hypothetical protein
MRTPCCVSVLAAVLVGWLGNPAEAIELVRDGRPVATIVVESGPEEALAAPGGRGGRNAKGGKAARRDGGEQGSDALAVQILVEWVKKITDAELPVAASAPKGQTAIYVGRAAVAAGLKLDDIASPSHEGLRIAVGPNRVLVAGQNGTATVKAVCRLLEELGCRYLMDGPLGEVYPRQKTLAVDALAITEKPGLMYRNPKGPTWRGGYWKLWNGAGGETMAHAHSWGNYLPASLFDEHPEYFAMGKDGQRHNVPWACTSNPDLRKYFAERVIAAIQAGQRHPSLSPSDGRSYCRCPACLAQDDPKSLEPSSGTVSVSNRYADFFDAVARQVAPVRPTSILSFYCYADYTQPPTLGRQLSPNLSAVIAPIRYCRLHALGDPNCPSRLQQIEMIEGWAKIADHLGYYNYMYNLADGTLPFFKFTACKKEFPYLADKGLTMMTLEVLSNWHIYGPHIYLGLRLAYDPRASAEAIMEDYWQKFYGPAAAPHMKAYWMGIDEATGRLKCHSGGFYGLQEIYTPEFLEQCHARLRQAAEAAKSDPIYAQRVAMHAEGLESAVQYREISDAMNRGRFDQALAAYDRMFQRLEGLAAKGYANREYATAYLRRMLSRSVQCGATVTAAPNKLVQVLPDQWLVTHDDQDQGEAKGLHRVDADTAAWRRVATYSRTLNSQGLRENSVLWYRGSFTVPAEHGRLALFFAEVDGTTDVYINGVRATAVACAWQAEPAKNGKAKGGGRNADQRKRRQVEEGAAQKAPAAGPATPAAAAEASGGKRGQPMREGQVRRRVPFEVDIGDTAHSGENVVVVRADNREISELYLGGIIRPVLLIEEPAGPANHRAAP